MNEKKDSIIDGIKSVFSNVTIMSIFLCIVLLGFIMMNDAFQNYLMNKDFIGCTLLDKKLADTHLEKRCGKGCWTVTILDYNATYDCLGNIRGRIEREQISGVYEQKT